MTEHERREDRLESGRRRPAVLPRGLEPHPGEGDLPPCEAAIAKNVPCPRSATTHYGLSYLCDDHFAAVIAWEEYDVLSLGVYHAKRFLWTSRVEGLDRLEYHVGNALSEMSEDLEGQKKHAEEVQRKADLAGQSPSGQSPSAGTP